MPDKLCNKDCCNSNENVLPKSRDAPDGYRYRTVFFGATREYGPEEGWQTVSFKKKGRKSRQWKSRALKNMSSPS